MTMMGKDVPNWAKRGWQVRLETGEVINEGEREWREIPKRYIVGLSLFFDGRKWELKGKRDYFQKHRASEIPGIPNSFRVESRTIGFYDESGKKVCYTVNEHTGEFKLEVI